MNRFLSKLFSRSTSSAKTRAMARRTTRLSLEGLEDCYCPSTMDLQTALDYEIQHGVQATVNQLHTPLMNDAQQLGLDVFFAELLSPTP